MENSGKAISREEGLSNGITDDVFNTGNLWIRNSINWDGYFFYVKDKTEIKGKSIGNVPLKEGPVIFLVKVKK
jgi:hypothetical protein